MPWRERFRKFSLSSAFAAALLATFLLSAGLTVFVDYERQRAFWQREIAQQAYALASDLQHPVQLLFTRREEATLQQMIQSVAADRRVKAVALVDDAYRILIAHRSDLRGQDIRKIIAHPSLTALIEQAFEQKRIVSAPWPDPFRYLLLAPLPTTAEQHFRTRPTALLLLLFDMTSAREHLKTYLRASLLGHTLNGVIFALLLFLALERVVGDPIRALKKALKHVRRGDRDIRLTSPALRELGELAESFNETVAQLSAQEEALRRRQRELEDLYRTTQELKERYQTLVELAQEGIAFIDAEQIIRYVNPAFARSLNYSEGELTGRDILSLIAPEDRARFLTQAEKLRQGETVRGELRLRTKGGPAKIFLMAAGPLFGEKGEFIGTLALLVDITELKHKEEALRQSEQRYSDLYNTAPDGYHTLAPDGTFLEINETELRWLGYRREEILGRLTLFDVTDEHGRRALERALSRLRKGEMIRDLELELIRSDGTRLPVRMNAIAEFDAQGNYLCCRATVRDITEQKTLEKQLLQAQKLEAVGALAGGIAHDFNNLLTGILGFTELALRELGEDDPRSEMLQNVLTLGRRGAQLVRQLLSFSRRTEMQRTVFDLKAFLTEMGALLRRTLPETIAIDLDVSPQIGNLEADPVQLQQVIMNLAVNARDAMPQGGTLTISCTPITLPGWGGSPLPPDAPPGRYVRLSVADTGVGMTPEIQARIFEPFFTTKEAGKGSGLGLSVVYGIVRSHGGYITVRSAVGRGSRFDIYLPITEHPMAREEKETIRPPVGANQLILLADDEPVILDLEGEILHAHGYRVVKARNGREAVRIYEEQAREIALVILDALMPEMTGIEAARRIRALNPATPILLVTGYNPQENGLDDMAHLPDIHFLQKPYTPRQLLETIGHILAANRVDSPSHSS